MKKRKKKIADDEKYYYYYKCAAMTHPLTNNSVHSCLWNDNVFSSFLKLNNDTDMSVMCDVLVSVLGSSSLLAVAEQRQA